VEGCGAVNTVARPTWRSVGFVDLFSFYLLVEYNGDYNGGGFVPVVLVVGNTSWKWSMGAVERGGFPSRLLRLERLQSMS